MFAANERAVCLSLRLTVGPSLWYDALTPMNSFWVRVQRARCDAVRPRSLPGFRGLRFINLIIPELLFSYKSLLEAGEKKAQRLAITSKSNASSSFRLDQWRRSGANSPRSHPDTVMRWTPSALARSFCLYPLSFLAAVNSSQGVPFRMGFLFAATSRSGLSWVSSVSFASIAEVYSRISAGVNSVTIKTLNRSM
jgi:hypothetical protein